jgi:DNA repair protein RadC
MTNKERKMIVLNETKTKIVNSESSYEVFKSVYELLQEEDRHKEVFYVMGLSAGNKVLYVDLVNLGTINMCTPYIRECLRLALVKNAVSVIVCHNHPSGEIKPSQQDNIFTKNLNNACNVLDIKLLDHIIIGDGFYSYADNGNIL